MNEMNTTQKIIVSWIPRLTSGVSFLGSSSIVYMILSDRKRKLKKSNHRLMLSLSIFDCLGSAAYAMTTLAFPSESDAYGAMGNSSTCTIQGFFLTLAAAVPLYNASLTLFYLFTIRHSMHHAKFSSTIEPFLHIISILVPLVIAITAASMGIMVPFKTVCSISFDNPTAQTLNWILTGLIASCALICFFSMASICHFVIRQSRRMRQYSPGPNQMRRRDRETSETVMQALLYTTAFLITFLFPAISLGQPNRSFSLEVLSKIFYPLQGFWNFLLYIRPGFKQVRCEHPGKNIIGILVVVVFQSRNIKIRRRPKVRKPINIHLEYNLAREEREGINKGNTSAPVEHICSQLNEGEVGYIASTENSNVPQKSPLHLEEIVVDCDKRDSDCDQHWTSEYVRTLSSSSPTGQVGLQQNDLGGTEDLEKSNTDQPFTPIRNERGNGRMETIALELDNIALELDKVYTKRVRPVRRLSLIGLATIESHYSLDDLDEMERSTDVTCYNENII